ncbi:uncharacterized membrane protein YhaH [Jatrophihabitans sp. GAS493]|uniref:DUF805 domain-containing protein n=1 Tax=Jatrophihabitans sp. GAS493 TaxID=1907575 RepID=UPI000BB7D0AF|nr:DUF805 domain-containing protein [Jatrophihabitans sp. GAS493]SOD70449.1 uncharacterized membrane protein YhaH [Jatrophihabitans sp. GAS493]
MTFADAVRSVLTKYATFGGRARRSEYWFWTLAVILAYIVVVIVSAVIGTAILAFVFILAVVIPGIAVTVRRLHDTNRSGAWYFIAFVPIVGGIMLLVFTCQDSTPGPNQYGPSPKDLGNAAPAAPYGQPA